MRIRVTFSACMLFAVFALNWKPAMGQAPAPLADCQQDVACMELKERAADQSKIGNLGEALRLYRLAYDVRHDPRLLFNIARILHRQGQLADAVPYYEDFLGSDVQDEEQRQKARDYLGQIHLAKSAPAPNTPVVGGPRKSAVLTSPLPSEPTIELSPRPPKRYPPYYRVGWIVAAIAGSAILASSSNFWIEVPLEGLSNCGPNVPPNQCPTVYSGNLAPALSLTIAGLTFAIPFGILLHFDVKQRRNGAGVTSGSVPTSQAPNTR